MAYVDECKWTCPQCQRTVTVYGSPDDTRCGLDACMTRHGKEHRAAAVLTARLRRTNVDRPAPRWGKAS